MTSTRSSSCILPCVFSHCAHCTVGTSVKDDLKREDEIYCLDFPNHELLERLSSAARNSVLQRQFLSRSIFSFFSSFMLKIAFTRMIVFALCGLCSGIERDTETISEKVFSVTRPQFGIGTVSQLRI